MLLALQEAGADIIELGIPFSDPMADGSTIQAACFEALAGGCSLQDCLDAVKDARSKGLTVPIVLMGYYNPFLAYGEEKTVEQAKVR